MFDSLRGGWAQAAASSTLMASGPDAPPGASQRCAALAARRAVDPDAENHRAGTLSYHLPAGLGGAPVRLAFIYGAGGYSRAELGIFPPRE